MQQAKANKHHWTHNLVFMPPAKPDSFDEAIHPTFVQWTLEYRPATPFEEFFNLLLPDGKRLFEQKDKVSSLAILI